MAKKREKTVDELLSPGQKAWVTRLYNNVIEEGRLYVNELRAARNELLRAKSGELTPYQKVVKTSQSIEQELNIVQQRRQTIDETYERLVEGSDAEMSIADHLDELVKEFEGERETIATERKKLQALRVELEGDADNEVDGVKQRIEKKLEALETSKQAWETKYSTLYNKIENLLKGATTVGLSLAYSEQKAKYEKPQRNWAFVFIGSVILMCLYAFLGSGLWTVIGASIRGVVHNENTIPLAVDSLKSCFPQTWDSALIALISRLPFLGPMIWLAWFASKQQSQYKRLEQEYAYKETLARSYEGFRKQIDDLQDNPEREKLRTALLNVFLKEAQDNPSKTLDNKSHGDKPWNLGDFKSKFFP